MQGSVVQDDDEPDDGALPLHYTEDSVKNRCSYLKSQIVSFLFFWIFVKFLKH